MKPTTILISGIVVLIIALWFGLEIQSDPGYLMIHIHNTVFETSVWFALIALIIVFFILYVVIRILIHTFKITTHFSQWNEQRIGRKARRLTYDGYMAFAQGNWAAAEKYFIKAAATPGLRAVDLIAAARAAQAQAAYDRRDRYINAAFEADPKSAPAILLTQAQLQSSAGQWQEALETIKQLPIKQQKSDYAMQLLVRIATQEHDWTMLRELLPQLKKQKVLDEAQLIGLEEDTYRNELDSFADDPDKLSEHWQNLPRGWRQDPLLINRYIELLLQNNRAEEVIPLIETALNQHWDPGLAEFYGEIKGHDAPRRLKQAQKWLKKHKKDAQCNLCCAMLSYQCQLWGQAKDYCEDSISCNPMSSNYECLGKILEQLDQPDVAMECYRKGLEISSGMNKISQEPPNQIDHKKPDEDK